MFYRSTPDIFHYTQSLYDMNTPELKDTPKKEKRVGGVVAKATGK